MCGSSNVPSESLKCRLAQFKTEQPQFNVSPMVQESVSPVLSDKTHLTIICVMWQRPCKLIKWWKGAM
eukprot:scaffold206512_cov21-Tisochrysis_lutea.AAC.1